MSPPVARVDRTTGGILQSRSADLALPEKHGVRWTNSRTSPGQFPVPALAVVLLLLSGGCLSSNRVPADRSSRASTPVSSQSITANSLPAAWQPTHSAHAWRYIVLHHTASESDSVESIHAAHLKRTTNGRPWLGIGYHFVIGNGKGMADGAIVPTFRWRQQIHGAHAGHADYNNNGIGIALVGNFEKKPPTPAQLASVGRLIRILQTTYHVPIAGIVGHGDVKNTACPGRLFPLSQLKRQAYRARGGVI